MPRSTNYSKTCGLRRRRTEQNEAVSRNINTVFYDLACIPMLSYSDQFDLHLDLGRSTTLFDISDTEGITTFWISYWKDLKGLQSFATSSAHSLGRNAYLKKKFPYMGVMHETYHSPKGAWETIYDNVPPLGLGKWTDLSPSPARHREYGSFVDFVKTMQEWLST